jgi:hypothetical protein
MSDFQIKLLPGAEAILAEHNVELPQKNELCGAFWITLALRALAAEKVEQDHVGKAAHSILSTVQTSESLPPGDSGRNDYILELPRIDDSEQAGTSPDGLVKATDDLAKQKLVAIPLSGAWTGEIIEALVQGLFDLNEPCLFIANSATRFLWGGKPNPAQVLGYLSGQNVLAPAPDWNVGHYIAVVGQAVGSHRKMALCADTYRTIGWHGTHLQPFDRIADSLRRDDSEFSGGAFVVLNPSAKVKILEIAKTLNLTSKLWDNGTPFVDLAV